MFQFVINIKWNFNLIFVSFCHTPPPNRGRYLYCCHYYFLFLTYELSRTRPTVEVFDCYNFRSSLTNNTNDSLLVSPHRPLDLTHVNDLIERRGFDGKLFMSLDNKRNSFTTSTICHRCQSLQFRHLADIYALYSPENRMPKAGHSFF